MAPLRNKLATDQTDFAAAYAKLLQDTSTGKDEMTLYADRQTVLTAALKVAGDQAAITAAAFQAAAAAMSQAHDDIQRDIALGFTTSGAGRASEANAFFGPGGSSMTDAQIRALYTPFAGQPLTNEQETTNKNIETFFRDFPTAVADALGSAVAKEASDTYSKVTYGSVSGISSAEAGGVIGRLDTANAYLASITTNTRNWNNGTAAYYGGGTDLRPQSAQNVNINFYISGQQVASFIDSLNNPGVYQFFDRTNTRGYIRGLAGAGAPRT
jgi:hypothetical protein